jgi:hypothetical protein
VPPVSPLPAFDVVAFVAAFDDERRAQGLGWYQFADALWQQSAQLNAVRADHPI